MSRCEICQNSKTTFFHSLGKFSYYLCTRCRTLFLSPKPSNYQIKNYYSSQFTYDAAESNEVRIRKRAHITLTKLKKMNPKGESLLDIGSGYGFLLEESKKYGIKALGLEPAKKLYSRAHENTKNLSFDYYFKKNSKIRFDFITMIHLIEHVADPREIIQKARQLLSSKGILYIETPNLDSHLFYVEKYHYTFLTPPDHIWIFSSKSFSYLLKDEINLSRLNISTYSYPEHFMGILKNTLKFKNTKNKADSIMRRAERLEKSKVTPFSFKYLVLDKFIAPLLTPLLNIDNKGSILELYLKR
ncbi:class I SAM-dependent methyltransferase [Candidatus Roizmanbacteria bacterium]|nr:class I SAM-dependent methyltransferase [Candidatus Roizmanbacteria bacterium]